MAMEGADARTARIKELSEAIAKGRIDLAAAEKEIAAEVEELKGNIGKHRKAREKIAENIDASLLSRYQMIFNRRAGVAVALARAGTCQGCRMRLPPQLYNEIQKHLQIYFCPNCQRILYYEEHSPSLLSRHSVASRERRPLFVATIWRDADSEAGNADPHPTLEASASP